LQVSPSPSFLDPILDILHIKQDKPEAILNITKFGSFTANFEELPPPISPDLWIPLYGIVVSTIVGLSIPSIISWIRSKKDARKSDYYHNRIKVLYDDGKLDEDDIKDLDKLKMDIIDVYSKGKLNEKYYENLKTEVNTI